MINIFFVGFLFFSIILCQQDTMSRNEIKIIRENERLRQQNEKLRQEKEKRENIDIKDWRI